MLGFPKTLTTKIALESINDTTGPHWVRRLRQRVRLLAPLESQRTFTSKRVWRTAGRDQCIKYSNGKFREKQQSELNGTRDNTHLKTTTSSI